jgi:hypothetical protein
MLGQQSRPVPHITRQLGTGEGRDRAIVRVIERIGILAEQCIDDLAIVLEATTTIVTH